LGPAAMNWEQELWEAILQSPDDITPRLIYADWCDEQGDPRGEFIRIQCELAAYEGLPVKVRHLKAREAELWKQNRRAWNGEIHRRLAATPLKNRVDSRRGLIRTWEYHRGFVEYAMVEARAFLEYPEALFQIGPLRTVRIIRGEELLMRVLQSPSLPRLQSVEIACPNEPSELVQQRIELNRPHDAAHVAIYPVGCNPSGNQRRIDSQSWIQSFSTTYRSVERSSVFETGTDVFLLAASIYLKVMWVVWFAAFFYLLFKASTSETP
jgi:uncharacterized protein (TIGR02996 family)